MASREDHMLVPMQNRSGLLRPVAMGPLGAALALSSPQPAADLAIVNASVLTVDPKNAQAEAVAIRGNTFAAVGTTAAPAPR